MRDVTGAGPWEPFGQLDDESGPRRLDRSSQASRVRRDRTTNVLQDPVGASEPSADDGYFDYWNSAYEDPAVTGMPVLPGANPIATVVKQLWAKLATRDPQLKPIADGLRVTKTGSHSGPGRHRLLNSVVSSSLHSTLFRSSCSGIADLDLTASRRSTRTWQKRRPESRKCLRMRRIITIDIRFGWQSPNCQTVLPEDDNLSNARFV